MNADLCICRPEANLARTVCVGLKLLPVNTHMNHVLYELPSLTRHNSMRSSPGHKLRVVCYVFLKSAELTLCGFTWLSMESFLESVCLIATTKTNGWYDFQTQLVDNIFDTFIVIRRLVYCYCLLLLCLVFIKTFQSTNSVHIRCVGYCNVEIYFLGTFAKLGKATISFAMSVCPYGTTRLLEWFLWKLIFYFFRQSFGKNSSFIKIWQE